MTPPDSRDAIMMKVLSLVGEGMKYVTWFALAKVGLDAVRALAGLDTKAQFILGWFTSADNDFGMPWVIAIGALILARRERTLRRNKTEQMQSHILSLETRLDPRRSSSGLTPTGDSNPEDAL